MNELPVATRWTLDAAGEQGRSAISAVALVFCKDTGFKGTAFKVAAENFVTNEHVIRNSKNVILVFPSGETASAKIRVADAEVDLAVLDTPRTNGEPLALAADSPLSVGEMLLTWGYPLGYNGPSPLLSVGFLAGFREVPPSGTTCSQRRLVVNGAFNPGNSGGPLLVNGKQSVIGVVVSKHAPMSDHHIAILDILSKQTYGMQYQGTDAVGNPVSISEAQLVAEMLIHFRNLTQVMIGEAIPSNVLVQFLKAHNVGYSSAEAAT